MSNIETKSIDDLKANPKNPRTIRKHDAESLKSGMNEFGDLAPIVLNLRTGQLVGGHQRINVLTKMLSGQKQVIITQRFETPDQVGTVALGYVIYNNRQFAYREVDWPIEKELAANIAANRVQGEFNLDMLAEITHEINEMEGGAELLELTGQSENEINRLMKMSGFLDDPTEQPPAETSSDKFEIALTAEQREVVEEALGYIKANRNLQAVQAKSLNGAALFVMAREYLEDLHNSMAAKGPEDAQEAAADSVPTES